MRRFLKRMGIVLAAAFLVIQVVRPQRDNPPVDPQRGIHTQVQVTPQVAAVLERSCRDCHSHQTRWPWYSHVAPVSWLVINDVREAREHMNLSEWAKYNREEAADLLGKICKETSGGDMPLPSYVWMHRGAKLSPEDVRTLCEWSRSARQQLTQAK